MSDQVSLTEYGVEPQYESILDNEDALRDLFVRRGKSRYEIARIADATPGTVASQFRKFGIYRDEQVLLDEEELSSLYIEKGLTRGEIADKLDTSPVTVDRHINYYRLDGEVSGFEREVKRRARDGEVIPLRTWWETAPAGYEIWTPVKTDCDPASQVLHHRLLAVAEYGFEAVVDKQIHHKNGIPWDNRPENIEPLTQREHIGRHWHPDDVYQAVSDADRGGLIRALETAGYKSAAEAIRRQPAAAEADEVEGGGRA
jgi:DNA-binding CsgD family transcriptional regulator